VLVTAEELITATKGDSGQAVPRPRSNKEQRIHIATQFLEKKNSFITKNLIMENVFLGEIL